MQKFSVLRHRLRVLAQGCAVGCAGMLVTSIALAGEPVVESSSARPEPSKVPPALLVSIDAEEPESLPAASEAREQLLYDLGKQRRLFSQVAAEHLSTEDGTRQLHLEVVLHRHGADQAKLKSWWPPITERGPGRTRILFSGQLPIEARVKLVDCRTNEVRAEKTLVVQSKGRTITAGTTDVAGVIIARDIKKYLRQQHRSGVF